MYNKSTQLNKFIYIYKKLKKNNNEKLKKLIFPSQKIKISNVKIQLFN